MSSPAGARRRPTRPTRPTVSAAAALAALVGLQGVVLVGISVFYAVELAVAEVTSTGAAVFAMVTALVCGGALLLVGRGLLRGRGWSRSPALVTQLFLLPLAYDAVRGGAELLGAAMAACAVAVLVLLVVTAGDRTPG